MQAIILVVHLLIALALVGVVLLQKSEGGLGGLGGSGPGAGSMGGLLGGRAAANLLTRATAVLAGSFFLTSIVLAVLANNERGPISIIQDGADSAPQQQEAPMRPHQPAVPTGE
ncbi:MAG: preprotein translocase subunit SecG [Alphaproteobacteria bacterium]|nr:preprotein translocase subunit SecG [Alphaproteobacteria bacterium]